MIKRNTLIIFYIKTQTRWYLLKQISKNIVGYIFYSCSRSATSLQPGRFHGSDGLVCWWRRRSILLVFLFVQHNGVFNWSLHRYIVNCNEKKGCLCLAWTLRLVQLWIFPVELYVFEIGYLIAASVQVLSPHTGEYVVSHLHCSPLVLSDWHSWQLIIQEILPLKQLQLSGSYGYFLWHDC